MLAFPSPSTASAPALPQGIKDIRPAQGAGLGEGEVGERGGRHFRLPRVQIPTDGADQTLKHVPGLGVFPAEVVENSRVRPPFLGIPDVVGQLQVAHDGAVFTRLAGGAEVHA